MRSNHVPELLINLPSLTKFATFFHLPASLSALPLIEPLKSYYYRRLRRWTGHVARMPLTRAPRSMLICLVDNPRPLGCPQMNWGRTLNKAILSNELMSKFVRREIAADGNQWRAACGS
jgi:hypothetical protein